MHLAALDPPASHVRGAQMENRFNMARGRNAGHQPARRAARRLYAVASDAWPLLSAGELIVRTVNGGAGNANISQRRMWGCHPPAVQRDLFRSESPARPIGWVGSDHLAQLRISA